MLAVGSNNQVLTACSGEGTGVKWAAAAASDVVCDTSPVLGGSLDASCETILNIGAAGNDILATGVRVINGAACAPSLSFTCDTDTGIYRAGANTIGWTTAGAVGMTLGAEHLTISDGNVIISTSGHGIDFAAKCPDGTSATAEILDDYEYGTWSPAISGSSYTTQIGRYVKVGRMVHVAAEFKINSHGGSVRRVTGLPFTSASTGLSTAMSISYFSDLAVDVLWIGVYVETDATAMQFPQLTSAGRAVDSAAADIWGDCARVNFAGVYEAAA